MILRKEFILLYGTNREMCIGEIFRVLHVEVARVGVSFIRLSCD